VQLKKGAAHQRCEQGRISRTGAVYPMRYAAFFHDGGPGVQMLSQYIHGLAKVFKEGISVFFLAHAGGWAMTGE